MASDNEGRNDKGGAPDAVMDWALAADKDGSVVGAADSGGSGAVKPGAPDAVVDCGSTAVSGG